MPTYHKITINGSVFFREFDTTRGYYENEMLTEDELIQQLMEEVVEAEVEIDEGEIERAINCISSPFQRKMVQNYINYLEAVLSPLSKLTTFLYRNLRHF
ncbi:hypothetical protein [Bacillus dakarensis]|uniref:hypothetical protein n=1 Tax=Robertmurraya dakarensis TaxID=1926278 RepID=UPI0009815199|nr:hypothetical protein [Bacillus dakarensis]